MVLSSFPLYVQDGRTALTTASRSGHDHIVEELLRRDANVNHREEVSTQDLKVASDFSCAVHSEVYYVHCWLHCNQILCQCCTSQSKVVDSSHILEQDSKNAHTEFSLGLNQVVCAAWFAMVPPGLLGFRVLYRLVHGIVQHVDVMVIMVNLLRHCANIFGQG